MTHNICMRKLFLIHAVKNYGRLVTSLAIVLSVLHFTVDTIPYGMVLLHQATGWLLRTIFAHAPLVV